MRIHGDLCGAEDLLFLPCLTPLVILDERTVDHTVYIEKVLPVALKYGNQFFGSDWVFQQDGAMPHSHHLSQKWCRDNFPSFVDNDC